MRVTIENDKRVDETWLELVINDIWWMVKRVRLSARREEKYSLFFDDSQVEVTVRRIRP